MKFSQLPLEKTGQFATLFTDYIKNTQELHPFYRNSPDINGFKAILEDYQFPEASRKVLRAALEKQYSGIDLSTAVKKNFSILEDKNTYTVTTGHQLCLFTGPLYFIYKIVTTINLAKKLKATFPDKNFVPVYWMATEDHDFEEINHFLLFNKKHTWEKEAKGAVGYLPTNDLRSIFDELKEELPVFRAAYLESKNLAEATRKLVNSLFAEEGLVIIDPDDSGLKKLFSPVIEDELLTQAVNDLVIDQTEKLDALGYKTQVHPREINFFYMAGDVRERIIKDGTQYLVQHTSLSFTTDEIIELVHKTPEVFSPNVVLRPVYQQVILPNIAYIGGPAEVCYWLQLKPAFDNYEVEFPILLPRNFGLVIPKNVQDKMNKLGIEDQDIFLPLIELKKSFLSADDEKPSLDQQKAATKQLFQSIMDVAEELDPTLKGYIGSEEAKAFKALSNIEKRLEKAHESRFEIQVNQLEGIKEKLFPGGSLQERRDNFLNFYINNPSFIKELLENFDPLSKDFYLIHHD